MRITKRTNIAVRLLMYCARHPGRLVTKSEIAEACNISENHLAQVINQLSQLNYLNTQRGRNGGMKLARPAEEIRIGGVFRHVEGPLPVVDCFADSDDSCPLTAARRLRLALQDAIELFYSTLDDITLDTLVDDITLDTLVCDNAPLISMMQPVQYAR